MDKDILFDPSVLTIEQRDKLTEKLLSYTGPVDEDGCEPFTGRSRGGKNKTVGSMSVGKELSELFGKKQLNLNPAALALSLKYGHSIQYSDTTETSHLCGFSLCLNTQHLLQEPKEVNNDRIAHHNMKDLAVVKCDGHLSYDKEKFPPCILKKVKPSYIHSQYI